VPIARRLARTDFGSSIFPQIRINIVLFKQKN
jgi:hypothetical protein